MNAFTQKIVAAATWKKAIVCGHKTPVEGDVKVFDEQIRLRTPVDARKQPYFCLQCLADASIRCALCTRAIVPGDGVTLLRPHEGFEIPDYAFVYSRDPLRLVGCMRPDCVDENARECGTWQISIRSGKGYVGDLEYGELAFRCAMESSRHYLPPKKAQDAKPKKR